MKKIMFNDKYGLTQAVLEGRKTQTRRIIKCQKTFNGSYVSGFRVLTNSLGERFTYLVDEDEIELEGSYLKPAYEIGEEVAVSQSYHDAKKEVGGLKGLLEGHPLPSSKGINNKMFVKADLMPHRIRITNVRMERLQDISVEDCSKEGVEKLKWEHSNEFYYMTKATPHRYNLAKDAFASLIDKTCGKGTWERNPWVFVYDFELVK